MSKKPKSVGDRSAGHGPARRFLLIFVVLVASYYAVTLIPWVDGNIIYPVLEVSARASSRLINLSGEQTTVNGIVIQGSTFAVAVRRGCDPLEPVALFGAAVVAFPAAPWRRKLTGLLVGSALLFGLNLLRIISLYLLGRHKSDWFDMIHLELWPAFFIIFSLSLWVLWLIWIRRTPFQHA